MTNDYPTNIDNFNLKLTREEKNAIEVTSRLQQIDLLYAIQALQIKLGVNNSNDINSIDYKVTTLQAQVAELIEKTKNL